MRDIVQKLVNALRLIGFRKPNTNPTNGFISCTGSQLIKTMQDLATDDELRKQTEEDMRANLTKGSDFYIDEGGLGHLTLPLIRTKTLG